MEMGFGKCSVVKGCVVDLAWWTGLGVSRVHSCRDPMGWAGMQVN
jgi:hypothetical protein